jgi:hypothetical protein
MGRGRLFDIQPLRHHMPGDEAAAVATLDAFFERSTDGVAAGT